MNGFLSDCPGELPPGRGYLHNLPRIGAHPTAAIHLETRMDETDPQDRVQAAKEHLKEAADDLHSATKGGVHGFGCWSSLESQVVEISGYRDIRVGTLARLSYAQPRWF
jgi:hypothetical protein